LFLILDVVHLYIWSGHYARNAAGPRPFDHQKPTVMPGPFSVMLGLFFFFSLFVTFFTACNFHKLFFTVERGQLNFF
jgi:hypothetical protein